MDSQRETTTSTILAAAEKLFCERGFAAVSVRDIGREAGVSHALVHRYLGSKRDIYRAVMEHAQQHISAAMSDTPDFATAVQRGVRHMLREQRTYMRLITLSSLQNLPYGTTPGRWIGMERLITLATEQSAGASQRSAQPPAEVVIGALVSLTLGWTALESWMRPGADLEDLDEDAITAGLLQVAAAIAAQIGESPPPAPSPQGEGPS